MRFHEYHNGRAYVKVYHNQLCQMLWRGPEILQTDQSYYQCLEMLYQRVRYQHIQLSDLSESHIDGHRKDY